MNSQGISRGQKNNAGRFSGNICTKRTTVSLVLLTIQDFDLGAVEFLEVFPAESCRFSGVYLPKTTIKNRKDLLKVKRKATSVSKGLEFSGNTLKRIF